MEKKVIESPSKFEWIFLAIFILLLFSSFLYMDTYSIIRQGINFSKALFSGDILNFYSLNVISQQNGEMFHYATYDFPMYIVLGIWEMPLYLIERFVGHNILNNIFALLYGKSILLIFLVSTLYVLEKICVHLKFNKTISSWVLFLFCSTTTIFTSLTIIGQTDIMGIFFTLIGLYFYMRKDYKKFILFFSIAIPFKLFALFVFIPLLLLWQKNILLIIRDTFLSLSLTIICNLIFIKDVLGMQAKKEFSISMINQLLNNKIPLIENVSIMPLLFILICIFCFLKNVEDFEWNKYSIYIPFVSLSSVFISFPFFPYWIVEIAPYLPLMFFLNKKMLKINILFEMIMNFVLIISQFISFSWCYDINNLDKMLLTVPFYQTSEFINPITITNIVNKFQLTTINSALQSLYCGLLIAIVIINYPKKMIQDEKNIINMKEIRSLAWIRLLLGVGICSFPLLLYVLNMLLIV